MSVQAGVWNFDGGPVDDDLVEQFSTALKQQGPDSESCYYDGPAALIYRAFHTTRESRLEKQPFISRGGFVVTWDGRLDNREEMIAELRSDLDARATDVMVVACAFDRWGTDAFRRIVGDWAATIWRPRDREMVFASDFMGVRHIFYHLSTNQLRWSTNIRPLVLLAGMKFHIDDDYVAGYLAHNPDGHSTPYREIREVPPGHFVRIRPRNIFVERFWRVRPDARIGYKTDAEYEEHFRHVFRQSVRRRLRSDSPVLGELSGGLDSSSIVCMADDILAKEGAETPRLDTLSFYDKTEPKGDDWIYFQKIEKERGRVGVHIDGSKMAKSPTSLEFREFYPFPGALGVSSELSNERADAIRRSSCRVVLSGLGGDEFTGGIPNPRALLGDLLVQFRVFRLIHQLAAWSLVKRRPWIQLFWDSATDAIPPAVGQYLVRDTKIEPWLRKDFARRTRLGFRQFAVKEHFGLWLPTRRSVVGGVQAMANNLAKTPASDPTLEEATYPYLDQNLIEFVLSTPAEQWLRPGERRSLMRRALAGIVPAETGTWGSQIRTTDFNYLHLTNTTYLGLNMLNKVTSQNVYAGSSQTGTITAQTLHTYDGVAIAQSTSANPAPNHDYTNFPATYNYRGNVTQVSRGLKSGSTWSWLNTNFAYNDLGEILTTTDPLGYVTTNDYTDAWVSINNPQCVTSTHSYAFPTTITDPMGHSAKHTYYSCTSLLGSKQDPNDIAASRPGITYAYDLMDRVTQVSNPDGGQTTFSYNDAIPYTQTTTQLVASSSSVLSKMAATVHDGLGRVQGTQLHDPDCSAGVVKVDYTYSYDLSPPTGIPPGRLTTMSNPYCTTSDPTYGITKTRYDALDRPILVVPPVGTDTSNNQATSYAGNVVTATDQTGRKRTRQSDALGRLTQVLEDPSGLNYETDYGYDVLDHLVSVTQKGGATAGSWRTRTFTYDSLSRLTCAANPEITSGLITVNPASCPATYTSGTYANGTIGYTYDADGNLIQRTAPAPNQTSASTTVTTAYSYDKDNRLTGRTYTGAPTTANVQFGYDNVALSGCTTTPPSISPVDANPIHNRTAMCDGSGATAWSHDPMGRPLVEQRIINGTSAINKNTQYAYYLDGEPYTLTYPNGEVVTYALKSGGTCGNGTCTPGRALSAVDGANNYVTSATYTPHGAIGGLVFSTSIHGGFSYNSRLQPLQIAYDATTAPTVSGTSCPQTSGSIMQRLYDFHSGTGNNGDIWVINNCRDTNRTQNFVYDSLNRVTQAYTNGNSPLATSWGETFTIDAWSNLTNKAGISGKTNGETLNAAPASVKNQLSSFCNDAAGNLVLNTSCPTGNFTPTYSYDIENRLTSAATGYTYIYDGDGVRVKKCSNSGCTSGTLYWDGLGSPLVESSVSGTFTEEYIFFNGKRVARVDLNGCNTNCVHYYFADHLGSADVITDSSGNVKKESDYYPYGGELVISGSDINNYKFTGKERDAESGLDNFGARYNSPSLGRFMTPDWAARPTAVPYAVFGDPQSLNLYGYMRNDPVSAADLDGHDGPEHDAFHGDQPCTTCMGGEALPLNALGVGWKQLALWAQMAHQADARRQSPHPQAQNPPKSPSPPGINGQAKKEFLGAMDHRKVGKRTVGSLARTLTREHKGLSGGKPGELQRGITEEANAIYNNASLKSPHAMAPSNQPATAEDKQVMEETYFNRRSGGDDPVEGRTYFGNSAEDLNSRPIGTSRQTVYDSAGPFDWGRNPSQFIYIYNDPGH